MQSLLKHLDYLLARSTFVINFTHIAYLTLGRITDSPNHNACLGCKPVEALHITFVLFWQVWQRAIATSDFINNTFQAQCTKVLVLIYRFLRLCVLLWYRLLYLAKLYIACIYLYYTTYVS
jgi:hypothetical protein